MGIKTFILSFEIDFQHSNQRFAFLPCLTQFRLENFADAVFLTNLRPENHPSEINYKSIINTD